mmetsp:Transcript_41846/g.100859  ORF Transcript_41846/g.100859 Transcript_41846/m.100859 type:complete len:92 (+) Transcript_41846:705-980(+)
MRTAKGWIHYLLQVGETEAPHVLRMLQEKKVGQLFLDALWIGFDMMIRVSRRRYIPNIAGGSFPWESEFWQYLYSYRLLVAITPLLAMKRQ